MAIEFICDIGSNHNRDSFRIDRLVRTAKQIGCNAVKFQLFMGERLFSPEFPKRVKKAREQELPTSAIPMIFSLCRTLDLEFHCTPFDLFGADLLQPFIDAYKIASSSILDLKLIEACAKTGKPLGISTGGATAAEIGAAYSTARESLPGNKITLYHCVPEYPAPLRSGMMTTIKQLGGPVGYSDHTQRTEAILAAIAAGAHTIEFHLDLNDRAGMESIYGHCWTASEVLSMISMACVFDSILNGEEEPQEYEEMRRWRNDPEDEARPLKQWRKSI